MADKVEEKNKPKRKVATEVHLFDKNLPTEHGYLIEDESFSKTITSLFGDTKTCDIIIKLNDKVYQCHSYVVFQLSKYFYDLNMKKKYEKKKGGKKTFDISNLKISNLDFEKIIKFFYFGEFSIPEAKQEIKWLKITHTLKIDGLRQGMLAYLGTFFTPKDAVEIVEKSLQLKQFNLYEICVKLIETYDEVIFVKTKYFLNFSTQTMLHFVKFGKLTISEVEVFRCVLLYCTKKFEENKYKTPKEFFKGVFEEFIKYPLIDPQELCEKVEKIKWVDTKYLLEAYRFGAISDELKEEFMSVRSKPREYSTVGKFRGSKILNAKMQVELFRMFLEDKPKKKQWEQIFVGSKDGFTGSIFHSKCDGKGPTMVIIESTCDCIFGAFTNISWSTQSRYVTDNTAWLFSIKKGQKIDPYKCKAKQGSSNHLYHHMTYGPTYGGNHDLYVSPTPNTQQCYSNVGHSYTLPSGKTQYFTSSRNYTVKDYEVFRLK